MNNEPNTPLDANGDPKTDYQRGYDLGRACDTAEFSRMIRADYMVLGKDYSEFNAGWLDGTLDHWLANMRRELRGVHPNVAIQLMATLNAAIIAITMQRGLDNEQK